MRYLIQEKIFEKILLVYNDLDLYSKELIMKLLNYFNGDDLASSVWLGKYAQEGLFIFYTLKSNFGYRNRYVKQITKNK